MGIQRTGEWTDPSALDDQIQSITIAIVASFRWEQ
jgi:hypothetical protein